MPSIRKLPNGRWIAQVRRVGHESRSKTFDTLTTARDWAYREESSLQSQSASKRADIGLHALLEWFDRTQVPRYRSQATALGITRTLRRYLPDIALNRLSVLHVGGYRDRRLNEGLSPASVTRELNLLSRAVSLAVSELGADLTNNPAQAVRRPQAQNLRDRRPTQAELDALRQAVRQEGSELGLVITLAITTGMRQGELFKLRIENIDLRKRTALLPHTKNGESRLVPLSPGALQAIEMLSKARTQGALITQWSTQSGLKQAWRRACKAAGISNLRFHDLRHEAASRFFELGLNQFQVASITGHKTLQMLKRYTHLRAEDLARVLEERAP